MTLSIVFFVSWFELDFFKTVAGLQHLDKCALAIVFPFLLGVLLELQLGETGVTFKDLSHSFHPFVGNMA